VDGEVRARFDSRCAWPPIADRIDSPEQFRFYRDMPGGMFARLREQVRRRLHARGIRVFVRLQPWARWTYDELGEIRHGFDDDGVSDVDTMKDAPDRLAEP